jgi:hypothetical protein
MPLAFIAVSSPSADSRPKESIEAVRTAIGRVKLRSQGIRNMKSFNTDSASTPLLMM